MLGTVGAVLGGAASVAEAALSPVSTFLMGTPLGDGTLSGGAAVPVASKMKRATVVNPHAPISGWNVNPRAPRAGGGFVLYPSKVNANQQRAVYSK